MLTHETAMANIKEHYVGLENTIMQRLKWAAGANPTLQSVIKQLTDALAENNKTVQVQVLLCKRIFRKGIINIVNIERS